MGKKAEPKGKLKIFISWSGELSHKIALCLKGWIPLVIQQCEPFVSSEDIEPGTRWAQTLGKALEEIDFGIVVVTKENQLAPWILFEAGALGKKLEGSNVCPLLIDLKPSELERNNPLLTFQAKEYNVDEIHRLMVSINKATASISLTSEILKKTFDTWWPKLHTDIDALITLYKGKEKEDKGKLPQEDFNTKISRILEEVLVLTRDQQKTLSFLKVQSEKRNWEKGIDFSIYKTKFPQYMQAILDAYNATRIKKTEPISEPPDDYDPAEQDYEPPDDYDPAEQVYEPPEPDDPNYDPSNEYDPPDEK